MREGGRSEGGNEGMREGGTKRRKGGGLTCHSYVVYSL